MAAPCRRRDHPYRRPRPLHLPLVRMEASQKCAKGVHIDDLAEYLDKRRAAAVKECLQLQGLR
ncbi:pyocin activator PrtN family protein [Rhodovulum sulfidophilum]|uniref:pyocin activator PrtN family protein n=1 Tax=Rhodovulum sulfidophilum TaxID=35806 RepID=UPI002351E3CC|nr:pyocin activator PrtN family protein [Rhodovulum sulfidophilum]